MFESRSPVEDRMGFRTQGVFRCSRATEPITVVLSLIITVIVLVGFYYIWGEQFKYIYHLGEKLGASGSTRHSAGFALVFSFVTAVIIIAEIVAVKLIFNGVEYRYTANANVFSFVSKKDGVRKTDIYYDDVVAVSYEERKLFGLFSRGYTVTIITHSLGNVVILYLFNKSIRVHSPENTPFRIIEERVQMRENSMQSYGRI